MLKKIIDFYKRDLQLSDLMEFPISPMSELLSHAIREVVEDIVNMKGHNRCGLDVGSGSGIQAAILAHCGCKKIYSIDISPVAVKAAQERFMRLHRSLFNCSDVAIPQFKVCSLEDIQTENYEYDIIVTNPPSYFTDRSEHKTPIDFGIYDGSAQYADDPKQSFLYKYFERIVNPYMKLGGVSICTWPGIEHRLVYDIDKSSNQIVHPTMLLKKWFGWKFKASAELHGEDFYSFEAPITGSCTNDFFMSEFNVHHARKGCYAIDLFTAGRPKFEFTPTFKFGILVLIRDENDRNLFRIEIISPKIIMGES